MDHCHDKVIPMLKQTVCDFIAFSKIADKMNKNLHFLADLKYYHEQATYVEKRIHLVLNVVKIKRIVLRKIMAFRKKI